MSELDWDEIKKKSNIEEPTVNTMYSKFNRFRLKYPGEQLDNTIPFLFITKPDCYFYEKYSNATTYNPVIENSYQFADLMAFSPRIFQYLQSDQGNGNFITPFYHEFESIDMNDRIIRTRDSVETANDWKTVYGHKMNDSLGAGTINVNFTDTRYKLVYNTLEAWIIYIDLITKGFIKPMDSNRDDKILDYAASAYYIVTAEDATTILYYCKFVGVFPLNIPDNVFSSGNKKLEYNIQFQYSYKDPTPAVITDFNYINDSYKSMSEVKLFSKEHGMMNTTWVTAPYIETGEKNHKLKWV